MYKTRKWIGASGLALIISIWGMSDAKAQTEVKDLKQSKPPLTKSEAIALERARAAQDLPIQGTVLTEDNSGVALSGARVQAGTTNGAKPTQAASNSRKRVIPTTK